MSEVRPSDREIYKRLQAAKRILTKNEGLFANPAKAVGELYILEINDTKEVWDLIRELLEEIVPKNYIGSRPPQKSYENAINGHELFAFSWQSRILGKRMYIKFALKNERFYYVSLHRCNSAELKGVIIK